jgi:hypothetical protein
MTLTKIQSLRFLMVAKACRHHRMVRLIEQKPTKVGLVSIAEAVRWWQDCHKAYGIAALTAKRAVGIRVPQLVATTVQATGFCGRYVG